MTSLDFYNPDFEAEVAAALEHLWDYAYLGGCSLIGPKIVGDRSSKHTRRSHIDAGRTLCGILRDAIENIRPDKAEPKSSKQRIIFNFLYMAYVEGIGTRDIAKSLSISTRSLYPYRCEAIMNIALILRDWSAG